MMTLKAEVSDEKLVNFQATMRASGCWLEINGQILLIQQEKGKTDDGMWGVPAGKLEHGETPEAAARRELFEETGIQPSSASQIIYLETLYIRKPDLDYIYYMFKIHLDKKPSIELSGEHSNYRWADSNDLKSLPLRPGFKKALEYYRKASRRPILTFKKLGLEHQETVLQWLAEPHIQEFWDTSPEFREDLLIFIKERKEPSPYWNGMFDYWVGLADTEPYCLLMTSEVRAEQPDLPETWRPHLSSTGRTWSIDFMIGNNKYLGQGLAAPTLKAFMQFVGEKMIPPVDTFFIDPAASNARATHVYEKAGFINLATFYRDCRDEKNVKHFLMVKGKIS